MVDLLDEIAVERLPDHLTAQRREQFDQRRAEREREDREREEATERLARFGEDVEAGLRQQATSLSDEDREQIEKDISTLHGLYSSQARALPNAMKPAADTDPGEGDIGSVRAWRSSTR